MSKRTNEEIDNIYYKISIYNFNDYSIRKTYSFLGQTNAFYNFCKIINNKFVSPKIEKNEFVKLIKVFPNENKEDILFTSYSIDTKQEQIELLKNMENDSSVIIEPTNECEATINRKIRYESVKKQQLEKLPIIVNIVGGEDALINGLIELPNDEYEKIYAITCKKLENIEETQIYTINQEDINNLNIQCIPNYDMPHMTYDILLGTKIIQQKKEHIYNIYVKNDNNIEVITNGIGFKRYLSQKLYNLNKINNQNLCYCCIDSTTCLLSGKNYTDNQVNTGKIKDRILSSVSFENKVLWREGIKQFFIDRVKFGGNLVYGFKKFTDKCATETYDKYVKSSSIYKFIFCNNGFEGISNILYDPFCIELKEDVDWIHRVEVSQNCDFYKNISFSLCKLGSNFCNDGIQTTFASIKTLKENTLSYYYNLMNRNLNYVLRQRKINEYTIVKEIDIKKGKEEWYCLFTIPSLKNMKIMGLQKEILLNLGNTSNIRSLQSEYRNYSSVKDNLDMIKKYKINTILITNPLEQNYAKSEQCGFGSYTRATFQIFKAFGIAYVNFDANNPSKLYVNGTNSLNDIIYKIKNIFT